MKDFEIAIDVSIMIDALKNLKKKLAKTLLLVEV